MKTAIIGLIIALSVLTGCQTQQMAGATIASQTFVIPDEPDNQAAIVNTHKLFIWDTATGNLANSSTGVVTAACTLAEAAIAIAAHGQSTLVLTATIPALDNSYIYGMAVCQDNAPASGFAELIAGPWLYDPVTNKTYSDTNPIKHGLSGDAVIIRRYAK